MTKWFLFLLAPVALLALTACGDGDDEQTTPTVAPPTATPTLAAPGLPSPSPVGDDEPALTVVNGAKGGAKTAAELRALPRVDIDAGGTKRTGITLATLAQEVEAPASAVATVEGRSANGERTGLWRGSLAEFGTTAIFVIDDKGLVSFVGSNVPQEQWLSVVVSVAFQ